MQHTDKIRATWQARVLVAMKYEPDGMAILSMLAHSFDEAMPILMQTLYPGFVSITTPFICSHAKIDKHGQIIADIVWGDWAIPSKNEVIFRDTRHLQTVLRKLADKLKLSDRDRMELFATAKKWVTADQRLDPNMDPADPDAKRLTMN